MFFANNLQIPAIHKENLPLGDHHDTTTRVQSPCQREEVLDKCCCCCCCHHYWYPNRRHVVVVVHQTLGIRVCVTRKNERKSMSEIGCVCVDHESTERYWLHCGCGKGKSKNSFLPFLTTTRTTTRVRVTRMKLRIMRVKGTWKETAPCSGGGEELGHDLVEFCGLRCVRLCCVFLERDTMILLLVR